MSGIMSMVLGAKTAIAAAVDAYFNLVTLLLPGDGTNGAQNNTFLDSSTNNFTITRNGNTTQGTFSPFSQTGWGTYFDGSSNTRLTYPGSSSTYVTGTGDFTIEMWINIDPASAGRSRVLIEGDVSNGIQFRLGPSNTTNINGLSVSRVFNSDNEYCSYTFAFNTWYHVCVVRSSATYYFFVNGVQQTTQGSGTATYSFATPSLVSIGDNASYPNDEIFKGYISNVRVSNVARYTSNFTPATSNLTALSGTQFLSLQNNRWVDNSTNASAITRVGNPSVQAFSPFAPTAAYSAATNGGSGYFDGSGDYLSVSNAAFNFSATDFTIEFWFYNAGTTGSDVMLFQWGSGASGDIQFVINQGGTTGNIALGTSGQAKTATATTRYGWNHIAGVKSGTTYYTYVNGVRNTTQSGGSPSTSTSFNIFNGVLGYISGLKISNTAVYTGTTLTVPTSPPTSDANTQLLCNFTNAGITDATAKNVLETVGNAQISTTQSKFGGSSLYFDGTGDRLYIPDGKGYVNGTEPFTLECWVYLGGTPNYWTIFGSSSGSGLLFTVQNLTTVIVNPSGAGNTLSGTTSLTAGTWFHLALTRNSSNRFDIWVNGVSVGNATSSQSFGTPTHFVIGAADNSGGQQFNGYLDDVRISKFCRYTTTFTPPTAAFPLS